MSVHPKPEGYQTVIPYLIIDGVAGCIEFMKKTFSAVEIERMTRPDGKISHAEVRIGDSVIMLSDSTEQYKAQSATLYLYLDDVDATYKRGLEAGGTSMMEPANQFYGDRNAGIVDSWGINWWLACRVENLSTEEIQKRAAEMYGK